MNIPLGWKMEDNKLVREFSFADFDTAMAFINKVADIARSQNHHPEIYNIYSKVVLSLSTHDAGDIITDKDSAFANQVNLL